MKAFLITAVFVLLLGVTLHAQSGTPIGPTDAIGLDYFDADVIAAEVSHFEAEWDGQGWLDLGVPESFVDEYTTEGAKTYRVIPIFTNGNHTVSFRACNAQGCGGSSIPFRVQLRKR